MPRTCASLVLLAIAARVAALPPLKRSLRPRHGALSIRGGSTKKTVTRNPRAVVVQKRTDVLGASFNLVNNVAGCGFLTLTAGAAGTGYLPAIGLVAFLGAVSCGSFLLFGEDALRYQASDVRSLWSEAVGANAWAVDASVAAFCGAAAVIYHGIVGDVFGPLVEKYLDIPPSITVYAVALLALFPLCQLDLATLAKFSLMGCASVFLTAFAILYRAVDGTYAEDGIHRASAVASEATGGCCGVSAKALVLSANLGLAYVAHYNAPPLAESLARGDGGARRRFRQVTFLSFTVLVALYAGVMAAGKATFGDAARPNVLLNYGASDALARVARLATGASIVFGFPLVFSGFYDSATRLLPPAWETSLQKRRGARRTLGSLCLVLLTAQVALAAGDIGLPAGLAGSLLGGFVVYVLPAMIRWPSASALGRVGCLMLALLGVGLGLLGAQQTLSAYGLI